MGITTKGVFWFKLIHNCKSTEKEKGGALATREFRTNEYIVYYEPQFIAYRILLLKITIFGVR